MKEEEKESPLPIAAQFIREEGRKCRLVSRDEIIAHLIRTESVPSQGEQSAGEMEGILQKAILANQDLKELHDPGGAAFYYSAHAMTEPYARILLGRKGDPLVLMAEIVRDNSARYPRPVPVESFREPPFEMSEEEIRACLSMFCGQGDFNDIRTTGTSSGALFLFSTRHLDPDHAAMLAERLDMGPLIDP